MTEQLSFQADAAVIDRLGRELVAKQETALGELVKNGYDADATEVEVRLFGGGSSGAMEIRDNGAGMSREDLIGGFLRLASDLKVRQPKSPGFNRQRAGRKGIGRFAAQRLGHRLVLTTAKGGANSTLRLTVEWDRFLQGTPLGDVLVELDTLDAQEPGTILRIDRLRDAWTEVQIKRVWRQVLALQQPFPVLPVLNQSGTDPGFNVRFMRGDTLFADDSIVADMQSEILDHLHAIIEMRVDEDGVASWRISKNRFGANRDWQTFHHESRNDANPPPYQALRNVQLKAYHVILAPGLLPSMVFTRVRDVLSREGGIRLYRNGFRVAPFGDPDNDWLGLDEAYVKRSVLAPITNKNFFNTSKSDSIAMGTSHWHTLSYDSHDKIDLHMIINARLDNDHARKLEFLHERTGARTTDIIKDAIDLYYRAMKQPAPDAARLLRDADFIGCGEAESDLSVRYKEVYSEILEHKHGNR